MLEPEESGISVLKGLTVSLVVGLRSSMCSIKSARPVRMSCAVHAQIGGCWRMRLRAAFGLSALLMYGCWRLSILIRRMPSAHTSLAQGSYGPS